jgi:MFS family permease
MSATPPHTTAPTLKWYQGLDRYCWTVLIIAALGWLFDTMDQNLFNLVRTSSLRDILSPTHTGPALDDAVKLWAGRITSLFIVGWATGGFLFGMLGDRLGRTRTMIITILLYALFTGLSGFAHSLWFYGLARFLTGMGVGGEFAAGAALVAETFPDRSRAMALGLLQALSTVGNMAAALITLVIGDQQATRFELFGHAFNGWRIAYLVGALPALLVLWIRSSVKEPDAWRRQKEAQSAKDGHGMGNLFELFTNPVLRRRALAGCLIATAGVGALWGVGNFSVDLLGTKLRHLSNEDASRFKSIMFFLQQAGAFVGIYLFALAAERFGRRPVFAVSFCITFISIVAFFWTVQSLTSNAPLAALLLAPVLGMGTLGPFGGFSIYFPELFPTRLRATGAGFCYNAARYLAAAAPFALGSLTVHLSYAAAATIVASVLLLGLLGALIGPETRNQPLPEHL